MNTRSLPNYRLTTRQDVFNHLSREHNLTALASEIDAIERVVLAAQWIPFHPDNQPNNGTLVVGFWPDNPPSLQYKLAFFRFFHDSRAKGLGYFEVDGYPAPPPDLWMPVPAAPPRHV